MKIRILKNLGGDFKKGTEIETPDTKGVPHDIFWQRRLRDSERDQCCEIVTDKPSKKQTSEITPANG